MFSKYKVVFILLVLVIIALVLFLIFRPKSPDEDKFVEVYVQLSIAQTKYQDDQTKLDQERKRIFSKYKFSQKDLNRLIKFYQKHPEKWVQLWEKINQRLSELIEREKPQPSR
jgi:membrane protein insertase Oxa1/YidC/SpoIIIJ